MSGFNDQASPASPDIFFRSADRLQLESYLTALRQENKSLALLSKHRELMTYYGELVVKRIHQEFPKTKLEVLLPADTEGLLDRFNAILNKLSFEVATKPTSKGAPDIIWLIQNANTLAEKDIEILLKLTENFPGAGVCAVLMFDTSQLDALTLFDNNPKLNTWLLSLPTPEQKLNAVQQARRNGTEEIAIEFFNQLAKAEKNLSTPKVTLTEPLQAASKAKVTPSVKQANQATSKKSFMPWVVIILGLLTISVGVAAVLHPEFGDQVLNVFSNKNKNIKAVQSEDSSTNPANPSSKDDGAMPEIAMQGQRWLKTLPEDHFVLEFQTFATAQEAQNEIEGKDWLKRAYIVPVRADGSTELRFLLVDGPFRTAEMAKKAASRMPNSNDIVIESVEGLRGYATPQKAKPQ
jgi:hypothetical protein